MLLVMCENVEVLCVCHVSPTWHPNHCTQQHTQSASVEANPAAAVQVALQLHIVEDLTTPNVIRSMFMQCARTCLNGRGVLLPFVQCICAMIQHTTLPLRSGRF